MANGGLDNWSIYSLVISHGYASDKTAWAGTHSNGVFKTTNDGQTWQPAKNGMGDVTVNDLAISPAFATPATLFAATDSGFFRSSDGGSSWTAVNAGIGSNNGLAVALSPDYGTDQTVFAGTDGGGLYKSAHGGASWALSATGFPLDDVRDIAVSPSFTRDHVVFASTSAHAVYKSIDGGATWVQKASGIGSPQDIAAIAISPGYDASDGITAADTVYIGRPSWAVFRSTDGGESWQRRDYPWDSGSKTLPDTWAVAVSPNYPNDGTVFTGVFGTGVMKSSDFGETWSFSREGMAAQRMHALAAAADGTLFAGSNGGGLYRSDDGGQTWPARNGSMSGLLMMSIWAVAASPDFATDHTVLAGNGLWGNEGMAISTDRGDSWRQVDSGLGNHEVHAVAFSPGFGQDRTAYAGTGGGVYRSTTGATSWQAASNGLGSGTVWALALSPSFDSDNTLFAGAYGSGVYRSTNLGDSWQAVNSGLTNMNVMALAISPDFSTDGTLFAATKGGDGVFRFDNSSATWTPIKEGLNPWYNDVRALAISPDFATEHTVYAALAYGDVYRSTDRGDHWSPLGSGLSHNPVIALLTGTGNGPEVYAATVGSSVWQYGVPCQLVGDLDGDGDVQIDDVQSFVDAWHSVSGDPGYALDLDLNSDGRIDVFDVMRTASNFGAQC